MTSDAYQVPVAISRLSEGETSREPQNLRAIQWLADQPGGSVVVVTPQKQVHSDILKRLVATSGVAHLSWKGFSTGSLAGRRVLYAWPNREHLNGLWGLRLTRLRSLSGMRTRRRSGLRTPTPSNCFMAAPLSLSLSRSQQIDMSHCRTAWTGFSSTSRRWRQATRRA